ncbi:MAG TPA: SLATT domain-containing protein [Hyalangium sp.]|nr:SLATT domain-containing protein [Hyalangium sp.]
MSNGTPAPPPAKSLQLLQKNIQGMAFPVLSQPEQPEELLELYQSVLSKGRDAMTWYARQKEGKKLWGQRLRMAAILLTALAGITPMIVQLLPNEQGYQRWSLLASIFAVLGATCVGLDNYFGASSGWMRYVSAYLELNSRLETLQFGWARLALAAAGTPKEQRLASLLDLLQGFIISVNEVVRQETQDWMAEFKGHLAVLEQRVEAQRSALATAPSMVYGAIKVMAEGSEKLKDGKWKVVLGTGRELSGSGGQAVVATSLGPGLLGLRFEAVLKDGRQFVTEDVTTIKSGEVTTHVFLVP